MRVDVKKYLVIGPESNRDSFFKHIQEIGIMEFIQATPTSLGSPPEIQNFIDALHVLRQMTPVKQEPINDYRSANVLARHVVDRAHELERLRERSRIIESEMARIDVFGDFSIQELQQIEQQAGRVIQFFFCKSNRELEATKRPEVIFIGQAYTLDYFISINKQRTSYEGLVEISIHHSLGELKEELAQISQQTDMS